MSWQCLLYSKVTRLYAYRHSFLNILSHYGLSQDTVYSSLFIHPTYNSLHPLTPHTLSVSCSHPPWRLQVCSLTMSWSQLCTFNHLYHCFRLHIHTISCGICLSLSDLVDWGGQSSCIHLAAYGITSFFLTAEYYSIVYVYRAFLIHSSATHSRILGLPLWLSW